jgi:hypothetical protein
MKIKTVFYFYKQREIIQLSIDFFGTRDIDQTFDQLFKDLNMLLLTVAKKTYFC